MTTAGVLLLIPLALAGQYLLLRPAARARAWKTIADPVRRRARHARRSLAALTRAALLRPYRGHHTPPRTHL